MQPFYFYTQNVNEMIIMPLEWYVFHIYTNGTIALYPDHEYFKNKYQYKRN